MALPVIAVGGGSGASSGASGPSRFSPQIYARLRTLDAGAGTFTNGSLIWDQQFDSLAVETVAIPTLGGDTEIADTVTRKPSRATSAHSGVDQSTLNSPSNPG